MSLHDDIMNLTARRDQYARPFGRTTEYLDGYKEARHAAAELALKADADIERLSAALTGLHGVLRRRHYGRMPEDVQQAYDAAEVALAPQENQR